MALFAPETAIGRTQIIPTIGPHEQIYCDELVARSLVMFGFIFYDADYGPNARVYRPHGSADAETIRSWLT